MNTSQHKKLADHYRQRYLDMASDGQLPYQLADYRNMFWKYIYHKRLACGAKSVLRAC